MGIVKLKKKYYIIPREYYRRFMLSSKETVAKGIRKLSSPNPLTFNPHVERLAQWNHFCGKFATKLSDQSELQFPGRKRGQKPEPARRASQPSQW